MEARTIECVAFYHEGANGDYFIQKKSFGAASIPQGAYSHILVTGGSEGFFWV